jgi:hypothetical protein
VHSVGERVGAAKASVERSAKANLGRGLEATNKAREMAKVRIILEVTLARFIRPLNPRNSTIM